MFLLDTNVVSETRKIARSTGSQQVRKWFEQQTSIHLHISVVTLFEIERGILQLRRNDPAQANILQHWFSEKLLLQFKTRILHIDERIALSCAQLHVPDPKPQMDSLIAATALVHGLTVVTRNTKDFEPMGVRCIDPWAV